MDVALRKRHADSSMIEKCVNAVTKLAPHAAPIHAWTEAHPELKTEHERVVAEILQQHIRSRVFDDVRMLGSRLSDEFGDFRERRSVSDAYRGRITHKVITQRPVNDFLFEKLAVGNQHLDAVAARDKRIAKADPNNFAALVVHLHDVADANATFAQQNDTS